MYSLWTAYANAGWPVPFPIPAGKKHPPAVGRTGAEGVPPTPEEAATYAEQQPNDNLGLQIPQDVVVIDVDQYNGKTGAETLAALESELGELPATWRSTRRGEDDPGGQRWYRLEHPTRFAGVAGPGIEILQHHHRYSVLPLSVVDGQMYSWYGPQGGVVPIPRPEDLPLLPQAWASYLSSGAKAPSGPRAGMEQTQVWYTQLVTDDRPACVEMQSAVAKALSQIDSADGESRHDIMTERTYELTALAGTGHPGLGWALEEAERAFDSAIGGDTNRAGEFRRAVLGGVAKHGITRQTDPCVQPFEGLHAAGGMLAPTGGDGAGTGGPGMLLPAPEPEQPQVYDFGDCFSERDVARAILARPPRDIRYARDTGAWLFRGTPRWRLLPSSDALWKGMAAEAGRCSLKGEADSEDVAQKFRAIWYGKLGSSAGSGAIGSSLKAAFELSLSTGNPLSVDVETLDAEPFVIWAGGVPWDIEASATVLTPAAMDLNTPHLHSAAAMPVDATPQAWLRFVETVIPDEERREWVLDVLAWTITGRSDRCLPIFYGPPGRGKSALAMTVLDVLGTYGVVADTRLLSSGEHHGSVEFALKGARFAFMDEGPRKGHVATERLKALTGGTPITGNPMRGNPVTFSPTHHLVMTSNDDPEVSDPALLSRLKAVECSGDADAVRAARRALTPFWDRSDEKGRVLALLIRRAARVAADPDLLNPPASVTASMEALHREQNLVLAWLDERTEPGEAPSRALYADYQRWCAETGVKPFLVESETGWGKELTTQGYRARHTREGKKRPLQLRTEGWSAPVGWNPPAIAQATPAAPPEAVREGCDGYSGACDGYPGDGSPPHSQNPGGHGTVTELPGGVTGSPEGRDGLVTGSDGGPDTCSSPSNEHEPAVSVTGVTGVTGSLSYLSNNKYIEGTSTSERISGENGERPSTRHTRHTGSNLPAILVRGGEPEFHPLETVSGHLATLAGETVTVDVEHTGYPLGHRDYALRTIQLGTSQWAVDLDAADPAQVALAAATLDAAAEIQTFIAAADLIPLAIAAGRGTADSWWAKNTDVQTLEALAEPQRLGIYDDGLLGLKELSARVLPDGGVAKEATQGRNALFREHKGRINVDPWTPVEKSGWAVAPVDDPRMVTYAASDVLDTAAVAEALVRDFNVTPPASMMAREREIHAMVVPLALDGLPSDLDTAQDAQKRLLEARSGEAEVLAALGIENPTKRSEVPAWFVERGAVLPETKTGVSVDKKALNGLLEAHVSGERPVSEEVFTAAETLLRWRKVNTALTNFIQPIIAQHEYGDGRVRSTIYPLGAAATGRMSSTRMNIQQWPKQGGIRPILRADEGHLLIDADFSSVEVRVAAYVSGDAHLAKMLRDGLKLHDVIAKMVWGLPEEHPEYESTRDAAKTTVFASLYGSGDANLILGMGKHGSHESLSQVRGALREVAPGFANWMEQHKKDVKAGIKPYTQHPSGRLTWFRQKSPYTAVNYAIQSLARELLVDSMVRWNRLHPGHLVVPVHDELMVQVPEDRAEAMQADLLECMTFKLPMHDGGYVPIVAELKAQPLPYWTGK